MDKFKSQVDAIIQDEWQGRMTAKERAPEELIERKFIEALPLLEEAAEDVLAAEAIDLGRRAEHEEGDSEIYDEKVARHTTQNLRVVRAGKEITPDHISKLLRTSLGVENKTSVGLSLPSAFTEIAIGETHDLLDRLNERKSSGEIVDENGIRRLEVRLSRLQDLMSAVISHEEVEKVDYKDLLEWVMDRYGHLDELQKLPSYDEARKVEESALRADLPLFERFLQNRQSANDYDLLMSVIEGELQKKDQSIKGEFLEYCALSEKKNFEALEAHLRDIFTLRQYLFILVRKKHGE